MTRICLVTLITLKFAISIYNTSLLLVLLIFDETQRALSGSLDSLFAFAGLKMHLRHIIQKEGKADFKCIMSIHQQKGGAAGCVVEGLGVK